MIPDSIFHCPQCGAPGSVTNGVAEYSCVCRLNANRVLQPPSVTHPDGWDCHCPPGSNRQSPTQHHCLKCLQVRP